MIAIVSLNDIDFVNNDLEPNNNGIITPSQVKAAITSNTILVSLMHINNEIGVINDIEAIGNITPKDAGVVFHVDAAQSTGKLPIDLSVMNIDLMSFQHIKPMAQKELVLFMQGGNLE